MPPSHQLQPIVVATLQEAKRANEYQNEYQKPDLRESRSAGLNPPPSGSRVGIGRCYAYVQEGTEGHHVGNDARQLHARFQLLYLLHASLEGEHLKLLARSPARLPDHANLVFPVRCSCVTLLSVPSAFSMEAFVRCFGAVP